MEKWTTVNHKKNQKNKKVKMDITGNMEVGVNYYETRPIESITMH